MAARKSSARRDPRWHAANIRAMLDETAALCRKDVQDVRDRRAKILFETTAEVLDGLINEFEHYEQGRVGVPFLNRFLDSMERIVDTVRPVRSRRGRRKGGAVGTRGRRSRTPPPPPSAAEMAGAGIGIARSIWRSQRK